MKTLLHKSVSLLLALVFFISTSGFTVYEHHCNCTDTIETILIDKGDNCCEKVVPTCCEERQHSCESDEECCELSTRYYKINTLFELPSQVQSVYKNIKLTQLYDRIIYEASNESIIDMDFIQADPLIKHQGIRLILYYHQLKIAPPAA